MGTSRVTREERSGWRDIRLGRRHREWGFHLPAADLDFLLIEYSSGEPRAIIEHKHEWAPPVPAGSASLRALARLAERAGLPAFVVRYGRDFGWWRVRALNERGREMLPEAECMTENEYVAFLFRLRDQRPPARDGYQRRHVPASRAARRTSGG